MEGWRVRSWDVVAVEETGIIVVGVDEGHAYYC